MKLPVADGIILHSNMKEKIKYLVELGSQLKASPEFNEKIDNAEGRNPWFAPSFVRYAADAIIHEMLNEQKLKEWLGRYELKNGNKTVGLIFAGNLPLVGFHDFLCCYVAGVNMKIK